MLSTHVEIVGCTFRQNTALVVAGACWFQRSDVNDTVVTIIDRCAFIDNTTGSRGALFLEENDTLLTNSVFFGNRAIHPSGNSGGGVFTLFDDLEVVNCLFSGNSAQSGGGITAHRSDVFKVTNSTLSGNRALFANSGGGILVSVTVLELTNSVLFGNRSGAQTNETAQVTGIVVPNFNTIQNWTGGLGGVGNHGLDPMFIDADGPDDVIGTEDDDLRLQAGSPAIDAADSTAVPAGIEVDLDGLPRFVDDPGTEDTGSGKPPIVDMGAFELQGIDCPADLDGNGIVGVGDLLAVLSAWGPCQACPEDINGDGVVGVADLLAVLSAWGQCP